MSGLTEEDKECREFLYNREKAFHWKARNLQEIPKKCLHG